MFCYFCMYKLKQANGRRSTLTSNAGTGVKCTSDGNWGRGVSSGMNGRRHTFLTALADWLNGRHRDSGGTGDVVGTGSGGHMYLTNPRPPIFPNSAHRNFERKRTAASITWNIVSRGDRREAVNVCRSM
jgi:hypothetical protein